MHRAAAILGTVVVAVVCALGAPHAVEQVGAGVDDWTDRRVLNVAHAGGDLEAPHSTLFAMRSAVAGGADVIELDVRLSADGVMIVQHDETVDRTTSSTGAVASKTLAELQSLDNAYWFVPDCWSCHDRPAEEYRYRGIRTGEVPPPAGFGPDDFAIPTLEQVAATFRHRLLDIEIKSEGANGLAIASALAAFIDDPAHGRRDRYVVASFDDTALAHFKSLAPHIATTPGLNETVEWFGTREAMPHHKVLQVPPVYSGIEVVTQQFVDDAHADGLAVWVWFNGNDDDQPLEWQRLLALGVDALLTGKPAAAQHTINGVDATFSVPPALDPAATPTPGGLRGAATCPALHVDRCSAIVVVLHADRGRVQLVAVGVFDIARGRHRPVAFWLTAAGQRAIRSGPVAADAVVLPLNADTAPAATRITIG